MSRDYIGFLKTGSPEKKEDPAKEGSVRLIKICKRKSYFHGQAMKPEAGLIPLNIKESSNELARLGAFCNLETVAS